MAVGLIYHYIELKKNLYDHDIQTNRRIRKLFYNLNRTFYNEGRERFHGVE